VEQTKDIKVKLFKFKEANSLFILINLQRIKLMGLLIKFQYILPMFLLLNSKKLKIEWQEFKKFLLELMLEKVKPKKKLEQPHD
jgi:hypothetical protein